MPSNNYIYKMSNAGGMSTVTRYADMLAGNTTWNPWEPAGAYESIAAITVPAAGAASVTFSSIPQTYTHLQIRAIAKTTFTTYANNGINIYFNNDTTSAKYTHQLYGFGSGSGGAQAIPNYMNISYIPGNASGTTNMFGAVICDILDYSSNTKNKTLRALSGWDNNGSSGTIVLNSAFNGSTTPINSILMNSDSGTDFMQFSQFALYGIKG